MAVGDSVLGCLMSSRMLLGCCCCLCLRRDQRGAKRKCLVDRDGGAVVVVVEGSSSAVSLSPRARRRRRRKNPKVRPDRMAAMAMRPMMRPARAPCEKLEPGGEFGDTGSLPKDEGAGMVVSGL